MLGPFKGIAANVHAVPIPDHACFAPDELAGVAASSASQPTRMTMSPRRSPTFQPMRGC